MSITPCLWFNGEAESAANFYCSLFPDSRITDISRYAGDTPFPPRFAPGTAMMVAFDLMGRPFQALNGGPEFPQTEAVSFSIPCEDQGEVDRYWQALLGGGGEESMCGWLKDRFGVSWQVVPRRLVELQHTGNPGQLQAMFGAMMGMRKLDIAALEAAFATGA